MPNKLFCRIAVVKKFVICLIAGFERMFLVSEVS